MEITKLVTPKEIGTQRYGSANTIEWKIDKLFKMFNNKILYNNNSTDKVFYLSTDINEAPYLNMVLNEVPYLYESAFIIASNLALNRGWRLTSFSDNDNVTITYCLHLLK